MDNILVLAAETGIDMAQVLRDTHVFYEGAWDKLVWSLGAAAACITIALAVIQILIARSNREALRVDQQTVRREIDQGVARAQDLTVQQIAPTLGKLAESVMQTERNVQDTRRDLLEITANTLHAFGGMSAQNRKYLTAASFIWTAAQRRCVLGKNDEAIATTLDAARRALAQATVEEALDDSEPLEMMMQLGALFHGYALGPHSKAVLPQLMDQLSQFYKKFSEAQAKPAGRDKKQEQ